MSRVPRALSSSSSWGYDLRQDLGGSFTARARSLSAAEFVLLDPDGEEFGRVRLNEASGVKFRFGGCLVVFEASGEHYWMVVDGEEVLAVGSKGWSGAELEISCDDQSDEGRVSFLRNLAIASPSDGETVVRLSRDLTGRRYDVLFSADDECALLVAVFLLSHVVANWGRVYRIGGGTV